MASPQAIENRRANRRAANRFKQRRDSERRVVAGGRSLDTLVQRGVHRLRLHAAAQGHVLEDDFKLSDSRYWQARACGWDAKERVLRYSPRTGRLTDPSESEFWSWWDSLHWKARDQLQAISFLPARPGCCAVPAPMLQ